MIFFLASIMLLAAISPAIAETYTEDWTDAARHRTVPVRIYLPNTEFEGPRPIVLLSHGLGGSREGFPYLGDYWSQHGYVVVVMQHHGSDSAVLKRKPGKTIAESMGEAVTQENSVLRYGDVRFVLDELERKAMLGGKLKGRLDWEKIAVGGHSFGSHTALAVVGRAPFNADPRIKAAIAMSPSSPSNVDPAALFKKVKVPVLHLTGTKDSSPIRHETKPEDRRLPYDNIDAPGQYLVIFKDGNHMLFSGHVRPFGLSRMEREYQPIIQEITLKFLDATLRHDAAAEQWLNGPPCVERLGDRGTF